MDTKKLELLLKKVSHEIIELRKKGYEVDVRLPTFFNGCELRLTKPVIIMAGEQDFSQYMVKE